MKRKTVYMLTTCCIVSSMLLSSSLTVTASTLTEDVISTDDDAEDTGSDDDSTVSDDSSEKNSISSNDVELPAAGSGKHIDTQDSDGNMDLTYVEKAEKEKEESESVVNSDAFLIANVDEYAHLREEPSTDSDYTGKIYANSVGEVLETDGEWYKIKSGNATGYIKSKYVLTGDEAREKAEEVYGKIAKVTTTTLYVREEPSKASTVLGMVPIDDELTVISEDEDTDGWVKVSIEEGDGYVNMDYVDIYVEYSFGETTEEEEERLEKEEEEREEAQEAAEKATAKENESGQSDNNDSDEKSEKSENSDNSGESSDSDDDYVPAVSSGSNAGSAVASFALNFVGNPYVYGGTSLTNGADCSGFVMSVYSKFGVSLPHSSSADKSVGYAVSGGLANAQPGDIICYSGHVAIYIGDGKIVHASTAKTGIKVSNADYRTPVAIRRIF